MRQDKPVNYAKLDYRYRQSHLRYVRRVQAMPRPLVCQECGGMGGHTEVIDRELGGPWFDCAWCQGTGFVDGWRRAMWLALKRKEKARTA